MCCIFCKPILSVEMSDWRLRKKNPRPYTRWSCVTLRRAQALTLDFHRNKDRIKFTYFHEFQVLLWGNLFCRLRWLSLAKTYHLRVKKCQTKSMLETMRCARNYIYLCRYWLYNLTEQWKDNIQKRKWIQ